MSSMAPRPLHELSKPFIEPGGLPPGIPLSIGMIASYSPASLRASVLYTQQNYTRQTDETLKKFTDFTETTIENLGAVAASNQDKINAAIGTLVGIMQENMAVQVEHGEVPSVEDLEQVFAVSTLLSSQQEIQGAVDPSKAKDERLTTLLGTQEMADIGAQQVQLNNDFILADSITRQTERLSRKSRLVGAAIGAYFGMAATVSLMYGVSSYEPSRGTPEQNIEHRSDMLNTAFVLGSVATIVLGVAGERAGKQLKPRIAHRRAKNLVKHARKRQA
jgi:hypothetical protein